MQAPTEIPTTLLAEIAASVRTIYEERITQLELRVQQLEARRIPRPPAPPS